MRTQVRMVSMAVMAAMLVGCGGFLRQGVTLEEFEYGELTHGTEVSTSIDAQGFAGEVVFVGQFNTPDPCHRINGRLDQRGSQLTLRLSAERTRTGCADIVGAFRYAGAIRGLSAGTYQLKVVHEFPGSNWQRSELNTSVTIR
jgi:hypothetical protein